MNQYERMMYCLARSQGAKVFAKNEKEAVDWNKRYLDEKKKYEEQKAKVEIVKIES